MLCCVCLQSVSAALRSKPLSGGRVLCGACFHLPLRDLALQLAKARVAGGDMELAHAIAEDPHHGHHGHHGHQTGHGDHN